MIRFNKYSDEFGGTQLVWAVVDIAAWSFGAPSPSLGRAVPTMKRSTLRIPSLARL